MKIKMLTTSCGPDTTKNWNEGQIREVCDEEGAYWIKLNVAAPYDKAVVTAPEKAVVKAPEKAVTGPVETTKGNVAAAPVQAPVAPPASPEVAKPVAAPAGWGTPEVK